jgi:hypothetical protein
MLASLRGGIVVDGSDIGDSAGDGTIIAMRMFALNRL